MLGFAAAIVGDVKLGGAGPLAQVAWWLGLQPTEEFYSLASYGFVSFVVFATTLSVALGSLGKLRNGRDDFDLF